MADCECIAGCLFFNDQMKGLESIKEMMKKRYCKGDSTNCARHMVFKSLGKVRVPSDLIPSEMDKAKSLIAAG
ncbi:MAG: hypothetical protein M1482_07450 [Chloroflexi bacterium]|nr:hypothetical protein [Chloroflexota bacterium]